MSIKKFFLKQALKWKGGVSGDQADKIAEMFDKNPEMVDALKKIEDNPELKKLFEKIRKDEEWKRKFEEEKKQRKMLQRKMEIQRMHQMQQYHTISTDDWIRSTSQAFRPDTPSAIDIQVRFASQSILPFQNLNPVPRVNPTTDHREPLPHYNEEDEIETEPYYSQFLRSESI